MNKNFTIPEILCELSNIPNTRLRLIAKTIRFPNYTTMTPSRLRFALRNACDVDKPKTFDSELVSHIQKVLK